MRAKFTIGNIEKDWVHSVIRVRQGCILSPLLFSLYRGTGSTGHLRTGVELRCRGLWEGSFRNTLVCSADDIVLIAGDMGKRQRMLDITTEHRKDFKVKFNRV
jgi:hypothetical protein